MRCMKCRKVEALVGQVCGSCAHPVKPPEVKIDGVLAAIDPGPTPGFAIKIDGQYVTTTFSSPTDLYLAVKDYMPGKIAIERFQRSNRIDTYMIATMECVGGCKATCIVLGIPFVTHTPGHQQAWGDDAKPHLPRGHTLHELSALSHLKLFENNLRTGKVKL